MTDAGADGDREDPTGGEAPTGEANGDAGAAGGSTPVLAAEEVVVERGGSSILDGVSLAVAAGDRLLVRGPSGAGKTTLFNVLGLLAPPTEGVVRVDGRDASALPERERARIRRDRLGIVYQEFRLVPDLTARENAALPGTHAGDPDEGWLDELFDRLGIADLADRYPATLSGGEKQRVAVARALANRPDVVLADEPTGQLDPGTAEGVVDLLLDLGADTGAALVVVSHDPGLGDRFERRVRIEDGRLVDPGGDGGDGGDRVGTRSDPDRGNANPGGP